MCQGSWANQNIPCAGLVWAIALGVNLSVCTVGCNSAGESPANQSNPTLEKRENDYLRYLRPSVDGIPVVPEPTGVKQGDLPVENNAFACVPSALASSISILSPRLRSRLLRGYEKSPAQVTTEFAIRFDTEVNRTEGKGTDWFTLRKIIDEMATKENLKVSGDFLGLLYKAKGSGERVLDVIKEAALRGNAVSILAIHRPKEEEPGSFWGSWHAVALAGWRIKNDRTELRLMDPFTGRTEYWLVRIDDEQQILLTNPVSDVEWMLGVSNTMILEFSE